jgi:hypothetical protein
VDHKVASIAAKLTERFASSDDEHSDPDDADLFEELDKELEDGLDLGGLRERRMEELRRECVPQQMMGLYFSEPVFSHRMGKVRDMRENEHGRYTEILDEKEVIRVSA